MKRLLFLMSLLVSFVLTGCKDDPLEERPEDPWQQEATEGSAPLADTKTASIQFDFNNSNLNLEGYSLNTLAEDAPLTDSQGTAKLKAPVAQDKPQMYLITNARGEIVMMTRDFCENGKISIDAASSAMALVTTFPLFAPVKGRKEFAKLQGIISSLPEFEALKQYVDTRIKAGKPLAEVDNTLISRLDGVLDAMLTDHSGVATRAAVDEIVSTGIEDLTRAISYEGLDISNIDKGPFYVKAQGSKLTIRNYYLTPYYTGKVYKEYEEIKTMNIPTSPDYGITDIFLRDSFKWGDAQVFDFKDYGEGTYLFEFECNNKEALQEYLFCLAGNVLDMLGAAWSFKAEDLVKREFVRFMISQGFNLTGFLMGDKKAIDIVNSIFSFALDFMQTEKFISMMAAVGVSATGIAVQAFATKLAFPLGVYCYSRGMGNAATRAAFGIDAMRKYPYVGFELDYKNGFVEASHDVWLKVISGNNQSGKSGEWLAQPLVVRLEGQNMMPSQKCIVRFMVMSGEGVTTESEIVVGMAEDASVGWRLGKECQDQMLYAEVIDMVTNEVISEAVYFSAMATDITDVDADLTVFRSSVEFSAEGSSQYLDFYTGLPKVETYISPSDRSWLSAQANLNTSTHNGTMMITVEPNTDTKPRSAAISVIGCDAKGNGIVERLVTVTQAGYDGEVDNKSGYITISPEEHTSPVEGDNFTVSINTNYKYIELYSDGSNWLSGSVSGKTLRVTVSANEGISDRYASLFVVGYNDKASFDAMFPEVYECQLAELLITQAGHEAGPDQSDQLEGMWKAADDKERKLVFWGSIFYAYPDEVNPAEEAGWWSMENGYLKLHCTMKNGYAQNPDGTAVDEYAYYSFIIVDDQLAFTWAAGAKYGAFDHTYILEHRGFGPTMPAKSRTGIIRLPNSGEVSRFGK